MAMIVYVMVNFMFTVLTIAGSIYILVKINAQGPLSYLVGAIVGLIVAKLNSGPGG